jgi:hypothetical protein
MSAMSFCRHGRPLRRLGNCSFMASMPETLMASTGVPSSVTGFSPNDPGGNSQSEYRPRGWLNDPFDCRSKEAVLNETSSHAYSQDSSGG